jgi:hypothetical protein
MKPPEIDALVVDAPVYTVIDRSQLERWTVCPAQATAIERGLVRDDSLDAESGSAVHLALSRTTDDYVASRGNLSIDELRDEVMQSVGLSRPDIQPGAIEGIRASAWSWGKFLKSIHHQNILRFDGGDGEKTGQLSWDLPDLQIRVTSEVDLLYAGPSEKLVHEVDYKSGHKRHGTIDVATSFQFQLHAWLILHNYPDIDAVEIRVWNTRFNNQTYPVLFRRSDLYYFDLRVHEAAALKRQHEKTEFAQAETWPAVERCELCAAAGICPAASRQIAEAAADPARLVDELVAREENIARLRRLASAIVQRTGRDITTPAGNAFGTGKARKARKPTMSIYSSTGKAEENGEGDS